MDDKIFTSSYEKSWTNKILGYFKLILRVAFDKVNI